MEKASEYAAHWDRWYQRDDQRVPVGGTGEGAAAAPCGLHAHEWHAPFASVRAIAAPYLARIRAAFPDDNTVLDVGCGSSEMCEGLRGEGFRRFSLLDISPDLVAELQHKYRGDEAVECRVGDCRQLPYGDARFALVIDKGTIDALWGDGDKVAMVRECLRVLRPGGVVLSVSFGSVHRIRLYEEHAAGLGLEWRMHVLREGDASAGRRLVFVTLLAPAGGACFAAVPHEPGELTTECLDRVARTGSLYEEEEEEVAGGGLETLFDDSD